VVPDVERAAKRRVEPAAAASALRELERVKLERGPSAASRKREQLALLERSELGRPAEVARLHDALLFLRAFPDDARVLRQVVRMLDVFARRPDLARHREALADSGIAGTSIHYRFYAETAKWLAARFPASLAVDWKELGEPDELLALLPLLAAYAETPAIDDLDVSLRQWVRRMKGTAESDGAFLVSRIGALRMEPRLHEALYDRIDIPMVLEPSPAVPSRTLAHFKTGAPSYRPRRVAPPRIDLAREIPRRPARVRELREADGLKLADLARGMMVTQLRDLDAFSYGDPRDAIRVDWEAGLSFAFLGMRPERRLLLESLYGYVVLENGVPIGYGTSANLFASSEVAFNLSPVFRGTGEGPRVFARLLASVRTLFGSDAFMLDPYQLGQDNAEAIASGAWWFYQKLGFRAREPKTLALMERELRAMRSRAGHRSSAATLARLAESSVFFHLGRKRDDVLGRIPLANVGLRVMDALAREFGSRREDGVAACAARAAQLTGATPNASWTAGERRAWERFAPVVVLLPGIERWPRAEREALASVVRAKGGRRESEFVRQFDGHKRLRTAVRSLAEEPSSRRSRA